MRTTRHLAVALLALPWLAGCSESKSSTAPDTAVNQNIYGVVLSMVGLAVEGAKVEVASGARAGVSTTTDGGGRFSLTGVPGGATLKVSKAGYDDAAIGSTLDTYPERPAQLVIFPISRDPATTRFAVSLTADAACDMLPEDVRSRTYRVDMVVNKRPDGADFTMPLDGADFFPTQRIMWGAADAFTGKVSFFVSSAEANDRWGDNLPIVERLAGTKYLAIDGQGTVSQPATPGQTVTIPFNGSVSYCANGGGEVAFVCNVTPIECKSSNHHLTLAMR